MNHHQEQEWEELFGRLPIGPAASDDHQKSLKSRALKAYDAAEVPKPQRLRKLGIFLMKHKVPHWAAAALSVAFAVWLIHTLSAPAFALERVVDNMVKARTARFNMIVTVTGRPPRKMKGYYAEPSHFRQELENGYINIADWKAGKMVGLDPKSRQATVMNIINVSADSKRGTQMNQFDAIRESLRKAVSDPNAVVESLGEKQLDGRTVAGFRFKVPVNPMTLWADPETHLPVRIESTMIGPPETKVVMSDYEFNVDLDEALFDVTVPDGYRVLETDVDASRPTEKDFIATLRMCCDAYDGKFPEGFDSAAIGRHVVTYLMKHGVKKEGPTAEQMKEVVQLSRGFQFALLLPAESGARYAGAGASSGDADRPVFWYKPSGSSSYRVLYADFSVKESANAPDVPTAKKLR